MVLWFFLIRGKPVEAVDTVTLAVLPLKGFGEEVSEDWFRDSMTDALITDLTKIGGLRVISQNSTMQYKDSPKSIPEIAGELHVEYVIDASIVKVGEQIRISAKLVNAPTNENIWAENFQRSFSNVLKLLKLRWKFSGRTSGRWGSFYTKCSPANSRSWAIMTRPWFTR